MSDDDLDDLVHPELGALERDPGVLEGTAVAFGRPDVAIEVEGDAPGMAEADELAAFVARVLAAEAGIKREVALAMLAWSPDGLTVDDVTDGLELETILLAEGEHGPMKVLHYCDGGLFGDQSIEAVLDDALHVTEATLFG